MQDFGEIYLDDDESWSHCFPSMDLLDFTLRNEDGNTWVGEVSMTHTDSKYAGLILCTANCLCECAGKSEEDYLTNGCGVCQEHTVFELGIDNDSKVDGDTKCRNSDNCLFELSWTVTGMFFVANGTLPNIPFLLTLLKQKVILLQIWL